MSRRLRRCVSTVLLGVIAISDSVAAESSANSRAAPSPRPRLTETLRAKAQAEAQIAANVAAVKMDKVIVRESPLRTGPPKDVQRGGPFSLTQGGYVMKDRGERFSTEIGLWRHIDIMEDERDQLRQSDRIRMGILRVSW